MIPFETRTSLSVIIPGILGTDSRITATADEFGVELTLPGEIHPRRLSWCVLGELLIEHTKCSPNPQIELWDEDSL